MKKTFIIALLIFWAFIISILITGFVTKENENIIYNIESGVKTQSPK